MNNGAFPARDVYDLSNLFQRSECAGLIWRMIRREEFLHSLSMVLMSAEKPYGFEPKIHQSTREARELRAAEKEMMESINRFDRARRDAFALQNKPKTRGD